MIGVPKCPPYTDLDNAPEVIGELGVGCGRGFDREDPVSVFSGQEVDQADLPGAAGTAEHCAQGDPVRGVRTRMIQPLPKIGPWTGELDDMLATNARKTKRERITFIRIRGYDGYYDAVRRYAASWNRKEREESTAGYVPLTFDPGEAYQFDWSHEIVAIDGVTSNVKIALVRHRRMLFVRAYPREMQEMVLCSMSMTTCMTRH